jgi:hypothetical protein
MASQTAQTVRTFADVADADSVAVPEVTSECLPADGGSASFAMYCTH